MEHPNTTIPAGSCTATPLGVRLLNTGAPNAIMHLGSACAGDDRSDFSIFTAVIGDFILHNSNHFN